MIGIALPSAIGLCLVIFLYRLRDYVCPHCKTSGNLRTVKLLGDEVPGRGVVVIRIRRCGDCGAVITDRRIQSGQLQLGNRQPRRRALGQLLYRPTPLLGINTQGVHQPDA